MSKADQNKIDKAARRGARWLDRHKPGWYRRIDIGRLDMAMSKQCILGQLEGFYRRGTRLYKLDNVTIRGLPAPEWYGFFLPKYVQCAMLQTDDDLWRELGYTWRREVSARLLADKQAEKFETVQM